MSRPFGFNKYKICGLTTILFLQNGHICFLDTKDFHIVRGKRWGYWPHPNTPYCRHSYRSDDKKKVKAIMLQNLIMLPPPGMIVDHINGDGLDNRRINLRVCTPSQNARNRKKMSASKTKYKGIYKAKYSWGASIRHKGRKKHVGNFKSDVEAAIAYDKSAIKYYGEFAKLNFPRSNYAS